MLAFKLHKTICRTACPKNLNVPLKSMLYILSNSIFPFLGQAVPLCINWTLITWPIKYQSLNLGHLIWTKHSQARHSTKQTVLHPAFEDVLHLTYAFFYCCFLTYFLCVFTFLFVCPNDFSATAQDICTHKNRHIHRVPDTNLAYSNIMLRSWRSRSWPWPYCQNKTVKMAISWQFLILMISVQRK